MPDISMCEGTSCPKKDNCHRYLAIPSQWQSWFAEVPFKVNENGEFEDCDYFWDEIETI